jgi:molecular chaperone GrpE
VPFTAVGSEPECFGVRKIEALGAPFDPAFHEAVMEVDDGSYPPGSVARVLEDGCEIEGRAKLQRPRN